MNISSTDTYSSNISRFIAESTRMTWGQVLLGIFLFTNMLITLFGNLLVLMAVYREKSLQTTFNFFIVNLAITDVAVAATAMSFYATEKVVGYWPFGSFLCTTWILLDYGTTFASVFTLVAISSDRFWSVFLSLSYRSVNKKKKSVIMLAIVWLTTFVLWVPPLVVDRINNPQPSQVCIWDPAHNRHFVFIIAIVGHHGPCVLMLFFYFLVFFYLRRRVKFGLLRSTQVRPVSKSLNESIGQDDVETSNDCRNQSVTTSIDEQCQKSRDSVHVTTKSRPGVNVKTLSVANFGQKRDHIDHVNNFVAMKPSFLQVPTPNKDFTSEKTKSISQTAKEDKRNSRETRVFITLTYIIVGYLVCWVPYHFVFDLTAIDRELVPSVVYDVTFWMTYINSTINPFLYNFSSPDFRRAFRKIVLKTRTRSASIRTGIQHSPTA